MVAAQLMAVSVLVGLAAKGDTLARQDGTAALKDSAIRRVASVAVLDIIACLATNAYLLMEFKNAAQMICVPRTSIRG
jgi:hypothetical protein